MIIIYGLPRVPSFKYEQLHKYTLSFLQKKDPYNNNWQLELPRNLHGETCALGCVPFTSWDLIEELFWVLDEYNFDQKHQLSTLLLSLIDPIDAFICININYQQVVSDILELTLILNLFLLNDLSQMVMDYLPLVHFDQDGEFLKFQMNGPKRKEIHRGCEIVWVWEHENGNFKNCQLFTHPQTESLLEHILELHQKYTKEIALIKKKIPTGVLGSFTGNKLYFVFEFTKIKVKDHM